MTIKEALQMTETDAYNKFEDEHPALFDAETLGTGGQKTVFLRNRLWNVFMAGVAAGRQLEHQEIIDRMIKLLGK